MSVRPLILLQLQTQRKRWLRDIRIMRLDRFIILLVFFFQGVLIPVFTSVSSALFPSQNIIGAVLFIPIKPLIFWGT
jgi:hypothetical protein